VGCIAVTAVVLLHLPKFWGGATAGRPLDTEADATGR
jgi:hypothetical protein